MAGKTLIVNITRMLSMIVFDSIRTKHCPSANDQSTFVLKKIIEIFMFNTNNMIQFFPQENN